MNEMGDRVALLAVGIGGLSLKAPGVAAILTIFLAGLAIGAAVIVWISLLVRKALLLVAIVFAPIALAGASWDQTRGWIGKWATFVIALIRSEEHTSELQSLMRISYAVFCLKKKTNNT